MSAPAQQRPRHYADLVQQIDGKRRDPVVPGSWVVVPDGELASSPGISLALVVSGPSYQHADGVAIQAVWRLHDGRDVPQLRLTAVNLAELLESATDVLRWLRNGVHPARIQSEMVRAHRAASLAWRTYQVAFGFEASPGGADAARNAVQLDAEDLHVLRSMVSTSAVIADLESAWYEMLRSRLPNLVRSLYWAGALEISRRSFEISPVAPPEIFPYLGEWKPNTAGVPHPEIAAAAPADLAAIGWHHDPPPDRPDLLVDVMRALGKDAQQASEAAIAEMVRAAAKPT